MCSDLTDESSGDQLSLYLYSASNGVNHLKPSCFSVALGPALYVLI